MDLPPSDFRQLHFLSSNYPERHRLEAWRDILGRKLLKVGVDPIGDAPMDITVSLRILEGLRVGHGAVPATTNRRTREIVARDNDDFFIMVNLDGEFLAAQSGREILLRPGDAYMMACSEIGEYQRPGTGRILCARVPFGGIASMAPNVYDAVARVIPREDPTLKLLTKYLRVLDDDESLASKPLRDSVTQHVYDLIALTINPTRDNHAVAADRGLADARLRMLKAFVLKNLHDPDLSLGKLAARHRMSARQVQRLFEREHITFSDFVLSQRLARVHARLGDPATHRRRISDIVLEYGFSDVSHFNRLFRRRYGIPPSDVRNAALIRKIAREN